jgi:hypothetical protein
MVAMNTPQGDINVMTNSIPSLLSGLLTAFFRLYFFFCKRPLLMHRTNAMHQRTTPTI